MSLRAVLLSSTMLSSVLGLLVASHVAVRAADMVTKAPAILLDGPAVDGVNAKIDGLAGSFADKGVYGARGSVTAPLGREFGIQFDGAAGSFDDRFFGSGAAHLFWRNPSRGLLGIYAGHTYWNSGIGGLHVTQIGLEGEAYYGRWSLQGIAGVEFGNSLTSTVGDVIQTYDVTTRFTDQINLNYYVQDNWKVFVGHRYLGGQHALALGTELGFALSGGTMAAVYAEGRVGENDSHGVWGGLRFYFGQKEKSLIQRHREDDPIDWAPATIFTFTNSGGQTPVPTTTGGGET